MFVTYNKITLNKTENGEISPFAWRTIADRRNIVNLYGPNKRDTGICLWHKLCKKQVL